MILSLGHGHSVMLDKIVVIVPYGSDPLKRLVRELDKDYRVIDATRGKKTKTLIVLSTNQAVLSSIDSITLQHRFVDVKKYKDKGSKS